MMRIRQLFCFGILSIAAVPALAHPHVFIANRMTVVFDGGMLKGISFQWTFDPMFTSMTTTYLAPHHKAQFSDQEKLWIKQGAFDNLSDYHYFVTLSIDGKPIKIPTVDQFEPSINANGRLVYSFFIPVNLKVQPGERALRLTVYDDTYYVAFDLLHTEDVTVQSGDDVSCSLAVEKTSVKPSWPGQYMPDQLVVRFKEKS